MSDFSKIVQEIFSKKILFQQLRKFQPGNPELKFLTKIIQVVILDGKKKAQNEPKFF